mmetsp:Transcript_35453/g.75574  ORF Transcript_35453/g.75574 Transcript_35453/m.75574 type:complete len:262 (-) Transcript_35453:113-898(-)
MPWHFQHSAELFGFLVIFEIEQLLHGRHETGLEVRSLCRCDCPVSQGPHGAITVDCIFYEIRERIHVDSHRWVCQRRLHFPKVKLLRDGIERLRAADVETVHGRTDLATVFLLLERVEEEECGRQSLLMSVRRVHPLSFGPSNTLWEGLFAKSATHHPETSRYIAPNWHVDHSFLCLVNRAGFRRQPLWEHFEATTVALLVIPRRCSSPIFSFAFLCTIVILLILFPLDRRALHFDSDCLHRWWRRRRHVLGSLSNRPSNK